jgi:hypothetical protein
MYVNVDGARKIVLVVTFKHIVHQVQSWAAETGAASRYASPKWCGTVSATLASTWTTSESLRALWQYIFFTSCKHEHHWIKILCGLRRKCNATLAALAASSRSSGGGGVPYRATSTETRVYSVDNFSLRMPCQMGLRWYVRWQARILMGMAGL